MLRRDNGGEDKSSAENKIEENKQPEPQNPQNPQGDNKGPAIDPANQSEAVQKVYSDVQTLKEKIEQLKVQNKRLFNSVDPKADNRAASDAVESRATTSVDIGAVRAAERAVLEHAKRDMAETKIDRQLEREKVAESEMAKNRSKEAQERFTLKKREAEEKRRQLEEAERIEAELKTERMKAEIRTEMGIETINKERDEAMRQQQEALRQQKEALRKKQEALRDQQREEKKLREIQRRIEKEKQEEVELLRKREARLRKEQEKEAKRIALTEKRDEAAKQKREAQKIKEERERLIAEQRALQRKERAEEKQKARLQKQKQDAKKAEDKKLRKARIKKERAEKNELRRQRKIAKKSAEMGGGIVNVHGTIVETQLLPVSSFSIRDLFGRAKKKEITAATTETEKQALLEENERIKAEARATAAKLVEMRRQRRANHPFAVKLKKLLDFCDEKKKPLLIGLSAVLLVAVGLSAVFNYCTAYEYSYAGQNLGYVKSKDDVLQITEMVQTALTEEKNLKIEIDPRDDIGFKRVYTLNKDYVIDSPDDVLRRLTYLGDVNVKSYGIYIDGQKVGAVKNKETAANVLRDMMKKYQSNKEGSKVEKAEIVEDIQIKKSNTPFGEMMSEDAMVAKLCTDSVKETVHTVQRGETLDSIAEDHKLSKKDILKDNKGLDGGALEVGSTIILKEVAPLMTVRITELRTYEQKVDYKTIKKKDKDLYEGYTEVDQKGEKGISDIKERTVSINGEVVKSHNLENKVKKEPVEKIVRIGTKERPPTVGSGTYIWPAYDGTYTVTSEFKWRWGRQHEGIDLGCSTGNDVLAADGGTVVYAGRMGGYGNLVIIDHQNGIKTYYGHNSSLIVHVGDKVFQGQHIAEAGNTGHSFGSHIHFGVMDHGTFKNPRNYLPKK